MKTDDVARGVEKFPVLLIDVDGTLLDTKADLTPFTREVLNRYLDTGGPGIPDLSTFQL